MICVLALGLAGTIAHTSHAVTSTISGKVLSLEVKSAASGNNNVQISSTQLVGKCVVDGSTGHLVAVIPDGDRGKEMLSLLEAALLSGKPVALTVTDGDAATSVYCEITSAMLAN